MTVSSREESSDASSASSRYVVGIDLGTTNCALAYVDTSGLGEGASTAEIRTLDVPQVTAPGTLEPRPLLPSFLYLATAEELAGEGFALPWGPPPGGVVAGALAARRAAEAPDRVVSSAKSWLCNPRVDRTAAILPWIPETGTNADDSAVARCSPLAAATAYLVHLRDGWNHVMAGGDRALRLEQQEIFLTVPASFDAVARDLTVRAAADAGFARVHLLEEPQAALYAWVEGAGDGWRKDLRVGDVLLVCDVGGGTTDFSVVLADEEDGRLALRRVAVGDHLLLERIPILSTSELFIARQDRSTETRWLEVLPEGGTIAEPIGLGAADSVPVRQVTEIARFELPPYDQMVAANMGAAGRDFFWQPADSTTEVRLLGIPSTPHRLIMKPLLLRGGGTNGAMAREKRRRAHRTTRHGRRRHGRRRRVRTLRKHEADVAVAGDGGVALHAACR